MKLRGSGRGRRIAVEAGSIKSVASAAGQSLLHPRAGANPAAAQSVAECSRQPGWRTPSRCSLARQRLPSVAPRARQTLTGGWPISREHYRVPASETMMAWSSRPRPRPPRGIEQLGGRANRAGGGVRRLVGAKVDVACPPLSSAEGQPHEITAGADTQFLVGVPQVVLHGSPAQEQLSGHVSIGAPAADQGGDLLLLRGQLQ